MPYLLDTNIAIHARDGTETVLDKLSEHGGEVLLSALSLAELQRGIFRDSNFTAIRQARLEVLLRGLPVLPFDACAAVAYGRIIAQCGWIRGRDYDRMIAAHAISSRCILVTNNEADFRDIPGLSFENWIV
ncbi:MAG TPA: type II toxin-antitoxin system VapC family toxin [Xanthobacteraceae bacterium]